MADLFQFQPEGPATRGTLGAIGATPTLGVRGGEATLDNPGRFLEGAAPDLSGGTSLPEFLNPLFEPKLKAEKARRFQEGYTAALMGKSQEEINKEAPWYTRVFGPVPYQLGAAKYQVDKMAADAETLFMNELPRLRTMPTEDVARELNEKLNRQVGDDPYTTALLHKSFLDRMPAMLDLHSKARYSWEQEDLVNKQVDAGISVADAYSSARRAYSSLGKDRPNDVAVGYDQVSLTQNLLRNLATPEFQDPSSTERYWTNLTRKLADNGNFDVLAQLMEHGLDKSIEPDAAANLRRYVDGKYDEFKDKTLASDPDLLERAVKLSTAAAQGLGGAATVDEMRKFDQEWQSRTGYLPYFDGNQYLRMGVTSSNAAIANEEQARREAKQAADEAAKARAKEMGESQIVAAVRNGLITGQGLMIDQLDIPAEKRDAVYNATYEELAKSDPAQAARVLVYNHANGKAAVPEVARRFRARVEATTGGAWNPAFEDTYNSWKQMTVGVGTHVSPTTGQVEMTDTLAGRSAAKAYFGEDADKRMAAYDRQRVAGVPAEMAYVNTFGVSPSERPVIEGEDPKQTKAIRVGLQEVVDTASVGTWSSAFGTSIMPTQSGKRLLTRAMADAYGSYPNVGDTSVRLKNAYRDIKANGWEVHGRAVWLNPQGSSTPRLSSYWRMSDDAITPSVDRAVSLNLKRVGFTLSDDAELSVIRLNDEGGKPVLMAIGQDAEGQFHPVRVTKEDIDAAIKHHRDAPARNREAIEAAQAAAARLPKL